MNLPVKTTQEHQKSKDLQKIATLSVRAALNKKDFKKLADLVELADQHGVNAALRCRAWKSVADHWRKQGYFSEAAVAYNAARVLTPTNPKIITAFFQTVDDFINEYRTRFSSTDLIPLKEQILRILEFYKAKKMWDAPPINLGKRLLRRLDYVIAETKPAKETPATHKTDHIVKALRSNVSFEEVKADYARIIAPVFREMMAKEIDEEKALKEKKKKKRGRKKKVAKDDTPQNTGQN